MLRKKNRYSFRKGVPKNIFATPFFVLRYQESNMPMVSCAVVVGKKVDKRAVLRNRIRRQVVVEVKKLLLNLDQKFEIVIYVKKNMSTLESEQMNEELKKAFTSTHIL